MPGGHADSGDEGEEQKREQRRAALLPALFAAARRGDRPASRVKPRGKRVNTV